MAPQPHSPRTQSPLTPGKPPPRAVRGADLRLIPAHAGKTNRDSILGPKVAAHPRSRGENHGLSPGKSARLGSSPLTRGKRVASSGFGGEVGLIPAHAGKTVQPLRSSAHSWTHPRSRGENPTDASRGSLLAGSSPLTRGKRTRQASPRNRQRLIPAHAGKTDRAWRRGVHPQAHPRSRGENFTCLATTVVSSGSSPLTRGKPDQHGVVSPTVGLIPAHAGKTRAKTSSTSPSRAHPRSRGENVGLSRLSGGGRGSSPLTRGKRHSGDKGPRRRRLIPAHAGKTHPMY